MTCLTDRHVRSMHRIIHVLSGFAAVSFVILACTAPTQAQDRQSGPWWPHPIWGADDQAGGSNWITPEVVLRAAQLVQTGKVYELGHAYEHGMPLFGQRTYSMTIPGSPTGGPVGDNQLVWHDEFVCGEIGQIGTQFDGPGHIGTRMQMADGTQQEVFYNGFPLPEVSGTYGLQKLGIENIKPIFTRGILLDIAGAKEVDVLEHSYEVTVLDVRAALERQGMSEEDLQPGDAIFFRYGWSDYWEQPEKFNTDPPGIGMEVAAWLVERQPSMIGSDQWATEVIPNPDPSLAFPVHQEIITKAGIWNLESMVYDALVADGVYEFLFVHTPIPFKGATGSPARPIAIR
jgi:kynurenine formamidase